MMNGVEILSSNEVAVAWESWNWTNFWVVIGVTFVGAVFFGFIGGVEKNDSKFGLIVFVVVFTVCGLIFGPIVGLATGEPTEYETHYKVTIDDSVSMNEFLDKYEILNQEGKIYTVKERE